MSIRITDPIDTAQSIYGIPLQTGNFAGGWGTQEYAVQPNDGATTVGSHVSYVCSYFCEMGTGNQIDHVIWETYSGSSASFGLRLAYFGATGWVVNATMGGNNSVFGGGTGISQTTGVVLPFDPRNKWLMCAVGRQNRSVGSDRLYLSVYNFDDQSTTVSPAAGSLYTNANPTRGLHAALGNKTMYTAGTTQADARNAPGICIPAIFSGLVYDGSAVADSMSTINIADLAASGIMGHIMYNSYANCLWATNHNNMTSTYATTNEGRLGKTATTANIATLDRSQAVFPNSHGHSRNATIVGTMSAVNPFLYGNATYPIPTITGVSASAAPATSIPASGFGTYGRYATYFADSIINGTAHNVRVGIHGNSRAVFSSIYNLRLSDGTYPGRYCRTNFTDMGVHGQAPIWNNGLVIGALEPIQTCSWSNVNDTTLAFTATNAEGEYGADGYTSQPRCLDSGGSVVNTLAVLTNMPRSTLGSRFGLTSRTAGDPVSSGASALNYRGNHSAVRLSPSCSYRIMVRPELGLPVTDSLRLRLYFVNHPSSSTLQSAKKVVGTTQNAAEDSSTSIGTLPGLGTSSTFVPPTKKTITAVQAPTLTNQVTHSVYGSVTVDDDDDGFASLEVGDLVQLYDASDVSNVYNEAFIVRSVTGKSTNTCVISYEWMCRQVPSIGDKITFVKYDEIIKYVECTFSANEVAAGKWRGIEIKADSAGDGLMLWGFEYYNPDRTGLFLVPIGRSGVGTWYQGARLPRVTDAGGKSLFQRIAEIFDLDLLLMTTADQGDAGTLYVSAYSNFYDYWHAASPDTEICFWSTGTEFPGYSSLNKNDTDSSKVDYHAVMSYVAAQKGVPWDGFLNHRYISAFGRYLTGDDTTESPTHPSTTLDLTFWAQNVFTSSYFTSSTGGKLRALRSLNALRVLK